MACTFTVQTGGDAQPMFQTGQDVLQIFLHSFGAARQVDDERFAAEDAGCTAEHPARVMLRLWYRMASAMPGALRSATARVASGVISRGAKPVPPVVRIRLT